MKTFKNQAAQGDFLIIRIDALPEMSKLEVIAPTDGKIIVAHSETGHNHVMEAVRPTYKATAYKPAGVADADLYELFLKVDMLGDEAGVAGIEHLRSFDTHETLGVPPGNYRIVRQREYVAEGFRRAAD